MSAYIFIVSSERNRLYADISDTAKFFPSRTITTPLGTIAAVEAGIAFRFHGPIGMFRPMCYWNTVPTVYSIAVALGRNGLSETKMMFKSRTQRLGVSHSYAELCIESSKVIVDNTDDLLGGCDDHRIRREILNIRGMSDAEIHDRVSWLL